MNENKISNVIAIDGPSGAGKSTVAKAVADSFQALYVDTGAMFRAIGLFLLGNKVDVHSQDKVTQFFNKVLENESFQMSYSYNGHAQILINQVDYTKELRLPKTAQVASVISQYEVIRTFLLTFQRNLAKENLVVMEGRDIGTVVFPYAKAKVFLTCAPEIRAKRRIEQLHSQSVAQSEIPKLEEMITQIKERDLRDQSRKIAPLKPAADALIVDSTDLSIDEVVLNIRNYACTFFTSSDSNQKIKSE